ncbi:6988_t:CDS:2, partial [Rhizophagus irregularis]
MTFPSEISNSIQGINNNNDINNNNNIIRRKSIAIPILLSNPSKYYKDVEWKTLIKEKFPITNNNNNNNNNINNNVSSRRNSALFRFKPSPKQVSSIDKVLSSPNSGEVDISLLATSPDSDIQFDQYNTDEWKEFLYNYAQGKFNPMATPKKPNSLRRSKTVDCRRSKIVCELNSTAEADAITSFIKGLEDDCEQIERRRALWRFQILNTSNDVNFTRIVALSKEHFKTSISMISLLNTTHQWFKAEDGMGCSGTTREISFCGHAILQENGEPFVVLDATKDWRFCNNPLVTDAPFIRFYAGAPLRTDDGYNIGTICVIDREPRDSFSKKDRENLKEYARVVMRELELWIDTLRLRVRNKMQESIAEFKMPCLYSRPLSITSRNSNNFFLTGPPPDVPSSHLRSLASVGEIELSTEALKASIITSYFTYLMQTQSQGCIYQNSLPPLPTLFPDDVHSGIVVPIYDDTQNAFGFLIAMTKDPQRQFEDEERVYLSNFGVNVVSEVLKRRVIVADRAKGAFISSISHELRTPLHGILASCELMEESKLNESQAELVKTIQGCGTSLISIINSVLDFAKLETRKKRVYDLLHPNQSHHQQADDVLLMIDVEPRDAGWWVMAEDGALKQLLMNIIGNSMKFTKKGYVLISLASLSYSSLRCGISPSFLSTNMFQPFSQENSLQVGTGLGLSIVKLLVEKMGGKLDVESEVGVGTRFRIWLDLDQANEEIKMNYNKNDDLGDFIKCVDGKLKEVVERYFKGWLKVKELICEDKENVTDSTLDGDIIFIIDDIGQLKKIISKVDTKQAPIVFTTTLAKHGKIADFVEKLQKEIEDTQLTQRKRRKVVILTRLCGPRKLEKAIVSVLSSQQDDEKLLEEENSYFPKLIMTPPISEDDNSKDYISYNSSEKSSSISPNINDPLNKSDRDSSLLSVAPPLRPCFNRSTTLPNLHLPSGNKEPKFLPIPKSTFLLTPSTSPCATPTAMSTSLPNMSESLNINPPPLNELKKSKSVNSLSCNLGPRVLVVEDNAVNRMILATFLKKRGIRFDEAENGAIG